MRLLKKLTLLFVASAVITSPLFAAAEMAEKKDERPNILLVVADDLGFGDLSLSGSITKTPNIDDLANKGVAFTNFNASPVCSITRGMLMTGNNNSEIGLSAFDYAVYPPSKGKPGYESYVTRSTTVMISELLKDAGYRTYTVGKWHLGGAGHGGEPPLEWGFDHSYGIYTGGANHWNQGVFHLDVHDPEVAAKLKAGKNPGVPDEPYYEDGKPVKRPAGVFSDELFTGKMMQYLAEGEKTGKPFFAYMAYTTPHAPLQAPDFLIDKYIPYYLEKGYAGLKKARFEAQKANGIIDKDAPYPGYDNPLTESWDKLSDEEKYREAKMMATYSAMMESQDYHLGLLLNYLRETGQYDNTLIIYMSDNGPEGMGTTGAISSQAANNWVNGNFSQKVEDIGKGNAFGFIGTNWADATTGGLQWWKWFIGNGGIRTPLIVIPPKDGQFNKSGEIVSDLVSVKDIPMTILDYAGIEHPMTQYKDRNIKAPSGLTIRDFLEGNEKTTRTESDWVAFELFGNSYVMAGDYKAIRVRAGMWGDGKWHLYNSVKDPGETTPLEGKEPERLQKMITIYEQYAKDNGIMEVADNWNPWTGFPEDENNKKAH